MSSWHSEGEEGRGRIHWLQPVRTVSFSPPAWPSPWGRIYLSSPSCSDEVSAGTAMPFHLLLRNWPCQCSQTSLLTEPASPTSHPALFYSLKKSVGKTQAWDVSLEDTLLTLLMFGDVMSWPRLGLCCSCRDAVEPRAGWLWDTEGEEGTPCLGRRCSGSWGVPSSC